MWEIIRWGVALVIVGALVLVVISIFNAEPDPYDDFEQPDSDKDDVDQAK
jgi:hypothetical membrane protein